MDSSTPRITGVIEFSFELSDSVTIADAIEILTKATENIQEYGEASAKVNIPQMELKLT